MKTYTVKIEIRGIEAINEEQARGKFWEIVDDNDYPITPKVEIEK